VPSDNKGAQPTLQKMTIVIHSMGMPFNGHTVKDSSLGGSESAAYYQAIELARRGHRVICWTTHEGPDETTDGVNFCFMGRPTQDAPLGDRFEFYARNTPHDVLIIQRHPAAFHRQFASKVNIWQLHDLALHRSAAPVVTGLWNIDAVTTVSDWHAQQVREVYDINPDVLHTVRNGVDPALYATDYGDRVFRSPGTARAVRTDTGQVWLPAEPFILLYQSRPERGLEHLVKPGGIMSRCQHLPVHLVVCGYDNTTDSMRGYYDQLRAWGEALPNVSHVGSLDKATLAALQKQADLLIYPTKFEEVSCITVMEAMHARLPILTTDAAALPETTRDTGRQCVPLINGEVKEDGFVDWLVDTFAGDLVDYPPTLTELRERHEAALKASPRTWSVAVDELEACIAATIKRRQSPSAIARHCIEHSDIGFLRWYLDAAGTPDTITVATDEEVSRLYDFSASQEQYAAHYAKHQTIYYDEFEERVIGEDVTGSTRFRGVANIVGRAIVEHAERNTRRLQVLDYGCAHGHYSVPLAKAYGEAADFHGIDITARAVAAANKWAERDGLTHCLDFRQGDQSTLATDGMRYDIILACEVVEHVNDYHALLEQLRECLLPGGVIIVTTPCGRWESSGTEAFRTGREHLHHFERADIQDICGSHHHEIYHAPASHDRSGFPLGSWVWAVWPTNGMPLWKVSYERKLAMLVPARQSISACLIVKNGEATLRKCISSFVDWVDEVIVAIDPATTDRTREVLEHLRNEFPNRHILAVEGLAALEHGFAAARNRSIEKASGDWILWVDADEELRDPWRLHMLARSSHHNGYGFAQIHYSADPPQVLTTDYPCRMFRNHKGVQFHGFVHEHPETKMGEAVKYSIARPEVKFLHSGYVDEETRRGRFRRNLPLLMRDRAENPERTLNKFLAIRDIAQGLVFELEQTGGRPMPDHAERGREGITIMEQIAAEPQLKMLVDAMPYYSQCVVSSGVTGFDVDVSVKVDRPDAPGTAASMGLKGKFHSRDFFSQVINKFATESTKVYESRYF